MMVAKTPRNARLPARPWKIVAATSFYIAAFVAAQQPAPVPIEGQIYITRKDRETVKMSLVTVRIVESLDAQKVLAQAFEQQSQARLAISRDDDWRARSVALANALPKMKPADAEKARQTMAMFRTLVISNTPHVKPSVANAKSTELLRLMEWPSAKTLQTDADGAFKAEMPPGNWTIVAWAERKILDNDEKYLWIVRARAGEKTLLNNSNTFD